MHLPTEILVDVLEYLSADRATLRTCVLVNRRWATVGLDVLWSSRCGSERQPFACLAVLGSEERQSAAEGMTALSFDDGRRSAEALRIITRCNIGFPRLHTLSFTGVSLGTWSLQPFLGSPLETVCLASIRNSYPRVPQEDVLEMLAENSSCLRKLSLYDHFYNSTVESLLKLLKASSKLESVSLESAHFMSEDVATYLLQREDIRDLKLKCYGHWAVSTRLLSEDVIRVPQLKALSLECSETDHLAILLPKIPALADLYLSTGAEVPLDILTLVAASSRLEHLQLIFWGDGKLEASDLLHLTRLSHLRSLVLGSTSSKAVLEHPTPEQQTRLFSAFPRLEKCRVHLECEFGTPALLALARTSPLLEELRLRGKFALQTLDQFEDAPFPCLRRLIIDSIDAQDMASDE
ncbi:hypothetical protein ANO11243_056430 [Dothideomycetidae sp. 11243]|nr:hypothetical protein ANO11243_056430 [fungal sp. No.11243]